MKFLFLAILTVVSPVWAAEELDVSLIPNQGAENIYVPVELTSEASTSQAKAAMAALRKSLQRDFHPAQDGFEGDVQAKCLIEVRHLQVLVDHKLVGHPTFRVWCGSGALWKGDVGLERLDDFESPDRVLAFIREFSRKHFARMRESILRHLPPGPRLMT